MVEVFKTDVSDPDDAHHVLKYIHQTFPGYQANFDLTDCDKILRIVSQHTVDAMQVIAAVKMFGFTVDVLEDELSPDPGSNEKVAITPEAVANTTFARN